MYSSQVEALRGDISPMEGLGSVTRFCRNHGGRKREASLGIDDRCGGARIGLHFFVKSFGLMDVHLTVQRVTNMFYDGSCPCSLISRFFAGSEALRADCDTLVSRPVEEEG